MFVPSIVGAQSFRDLSRRAEELEDSRTFGAALFFDCATLEPVQQQRRCFGRNRGAQSRLRRNTWLISLPAEGRLSVGPYEEDRGGLSLRVPQQRIQANGGALSTATPQTTGGLGGALLAEQFFALPADRVERWRAQNALERLRLRMVFRVGPAWPNRPSDGATIEVVAIQVYNTGSGSVLIDSTRPPRNTEGAPAALAQRVEVWSRERQSSAFWHAPEFVPVILEARSEDGDIVLSAQSEATQEFARFPIPDAEDTNLALLPHGQNGVLAVLTSSRPGANAVGHGEVRLYRWSEGQLREAARWEGSNQEAPPRWVVDPSVLPDSAASEVPDETRGNPAMEADSPAPSNAAD